MDKPKISIVHNEIIAPMGENFEQFYKHFFSNENHCETQHRNLEFFQQKYQQVVRSIEKFDNKTIPSRLRRRMSFLTQMIVLCASRCLQNVTYDSKNLAIILATGWGELETTEKLLLSIVENNEGPVFLSPTQFHNSVHNTAAGYLGIALKVQGPTLTISQENQSLETALEAATLLISSGQTALALVGGGDTYFRFSVLDTQNNRYPKIFSCGVSCFLLKENHETGPYIQTLKTCGSIRSEQQASLYFKEIATVMGGDVDILWLSALPSSDASLAKSEFNYDISITGHEENPSYPTSSGEVFTSILAILQRGELPRHIDDHVVKGQVNKEIRKVLYVKVSNGVYKSFMIWT
ncbi:beta-ketoacyl synthase chain length factor [Candidatus Uabimicrobium sp. HlEnr_7]|uniref:beta-ketoacyl synthase chain length factor n=1 Tax=Candidatus Uabimicrobium helgolandensis TaxID=3095367 RepID=UPI003558137E